MMLTEREMVFIFSSPFNLLPFMILFLVEKMEGKIEHAKLCFSVAFSHPVHTSLLSFPWWRLNFLNSMCCVPGSIMQVSYLPMFLFEPTFHFDKTASHLWLFSSSVTLSNYLSALIYQYPDNSLVHYGIWHLAKLLWMYTCLIQESRIV